MIICYRVRGVGFNEHIFKKKDKVVMARVEQHSRGASSAFLKIVIAFVLVFGLGGVATAAAMFVGNQQTAKAKVSYSVSTSRKQVTAGQTVRVYVDISDTVNYTVDSAYAYYTMPVSGKYYQVPLSVSGDTWLGQIKTSASSTEEGEWVFAGIGVDDSQPSDLFDNNVQSEAEGNFTVVGGTEDLKNPTYVLGSASLNPSSASAGNTITMSAEFAGTAPAEGTARAYLRSKTELTSKQVQLTGSGTGTYTGTLAVTDDMESGEWEFSAVQASSADGEIWTYNLSLEDGTLKTVTINTSESSRTATYVTDSAKPDITPVVKRDETIRLQTSSDADTVFVYYVKPVSGLEHQLELKKEGDEWVGVIPKEDLDERGWWTLNAVQMKVNERESYVYDSETTSLQSGDFLVGKPFIVDDIETELPYNEEDQKPEPVVRDEDDQNIILTENTDYTVKHYSVTTDEESGEEVRTEVTEAIDCGKYVTVVTGVKDGTYDGNEEELYFEITKVAPEFDSDPVDANKTYNGQKQDLIVAGTTDDGEIYYAQSSEAPEKDAEGVWSLDVPQDYDANTYKVFYWIKGDKNHLDSDVVALEGDAHIQQYALKVPVKVQDREYDGTTDAEIEIDDQNGVTGETLSFSGMAGVFADPNAAKDIAVTLNEGDISVTVTGGRAKLANYKLTYEESLKGTINPKKITIAVPQDSVTSSKVYDATVDAKVAQFEKGTGIYVNSEEERLQISDLVAEYNNKNVGADKPVKVTNLKTATIVGLEGTLSTNYEVTLTGDNLKASIVKASATITPNKASKEYGTKTDPALTATVTGLKGTDTFTLLTDYTLTRVAGEDVAEYPINVNVIKNDNTNNYEITKAAGVFEITAVDAKVIKAPVAVENLVYNKEAQTLVQAGEADGGTMMYAVAAVRPDKNADVWSEKLPAQTDANSYKVYYYVKGDKNHKDTEVLGPVENVKIAPHSVSEEDITVDAMSDETYTGSSISAKPVVRYGTYVLKEGTDYTLTYSDNTNVGDAKVTINGKGNYCDSRDETFKIVPKKATLTANDASRGYGEANPAFTITPDGLVAGETLTEGVDYKVTCEATTTSPCDKYPIKIEIIENTKTNNYDFTLVDGELTVDKVKAKVKTAPTAKTLTYNAQQQELISKGTTEDGTLYYAVAKNPPATDATDVWGESAPTEVDAETYKVYYYVKGDSNHYDSDVFELAGGATIDKYQLTVTPVMETKTYDGNKNGNLRIDDVAGVPTETLSFSGVSGSFYDANAANDVKVLLGNTSSISVTVTGGQGKASNYDITYTKDGLTGTITPKEITINVPTSAVQKTKQYDATDEAYVSDFFADTGVSGEQFHVKNLKAAYSDKNVGKNKTVRVTNLDTATLVGIEGTISTNYVVTLKDDGLTANITQAPATIVATDAGKIFDQPDPAFSANVLGLLEDDSFELNTDYKLTREDGENVGTYKITPVVTENTNTNNYEITCKTATFTIFNDGANIIKAPVAITGLVYNKEAQTLVIAGEASGGKIMYCVSDTQPESTATGFSEDLPTGTLPQGYSVYYYVKADGNHDDSKIFGPVLGTKIAQRPVTDDVITVDNIADQTYTGSEIEPTVTVRYGDYELVEGTDYTLEYDDNKVVGTATVAITGKGYYTDVRDDVTFKIVPKPATITVNNAEMEYGAGALPEFTIETDGFIVGEDLREWVDYSISTDATVKSDVGEYDIKATVKATDVTRNYDITCVDGKLKVTQVQAKVKTAPYAADLTYSGEAQKLITDGTSDDGTLYYAVADSAPSTTDESAWSEELPEEVNAGKYNVYYYVKGDNNHYDSKVYELRGGATIKKFDVTVKPSAADKTYDGTRKAEVAISDKAGVTGETLTFSGVTGEFIDTNAATGIRVIIDTSSIEVSVDGGQASVDNYNVTYDAETLSASILKKAISIAVPKSAVEPTKVYDATTASKVNEFEASTGVLEEKFQVKGLNATYLDKNVDTNKTVTVNNLADAKLVGLEGTRSSNYIITVTGEGLTANITKAPATITPDAAGKEFQTADPSTLTATVSGMLGTDELTNGTDFKVWRDAGEEAKSYTIHCSVIETTATANYEITCETSTFTIMSDTAGVLKAPTAVNNLVYNKEAQTLIYAGTPFGGTLMYKLADEMPDSTKGFSETLPSGTNAKNYNVYYYVKGDADHEDSSIMGPVPNAKISPRPVSDSVITVDTIPSQTYSGKELTPKPTVRYGDTALEQETDYILSYDENVNVGDATITISGIGNYKDTRSVTFKITPKTAILSVVDAQMGYGEDLPTFSATFDGLVWGTNLELGRDFTITTDATSKSPVGTYTLTPTIVENDTTNNYSFILRKGTLTIDLVKAKVKVAPVAYDLTYNSQTQTLISAATSDDGTVYYAVAESEPSTSDTSAWSTEVPSRINAGEYNIYYYVKGDANHKDSDVFELSGGAEIKKFDLKIKPTIENKVYNGNKNADATIETLAGAGEETVSFSGVNAQFVDANAATKVKVTLDTSALTPRVSGGQGNADNYNITYDVADLYATISAKAITIPVPEDAVEATRIYDGTTTAKINQFEANTGVGTEKFQIKGLKASFDSKNVGSNKEVTVTNLAKATLVGMEGTISSNYVVTLTGDDLTASITRAPVTITANSTGKEPETDDPDPLKVTVDGLVSDDEFTNGTDYVVTRVSGEEPGQKYDINVEVLPTSTTNNYEITVKTGTFYILSDTAGFYEAPMAVDRLVYNKGAQTLINAGVPYGGTFMYKISDTKPDSTSGFTETLPSGTNAQDYNIYYYVKGDDTHDDSEIFGPIPGAKIRTRDITDDVIVCIGGSNQTYTGSEIESKPTLKYGSDALEEGRDFNLEFQDNIDVGTATVTIKGTGNYSAEEEVTFKINKKKATLKVNDASMSYNSDLPEFSVKADGLAAGTELTDGIDYGIFCPADSSSPVGKYTLTPSIYTTDITKNYDFTLRTGTLTITENAAQVKTRPTEKTLTYNGQDQALIDLGTSDDGTLMYSLDSWPSTEDDVWSTTAPVAIDAGNYRVYYYVKGDANHKDSEVMVLERDSVINRYDATVTPKVASKTYDSTNAANISIDSVSFVAGESLSFTNVNGIFDDVNAADSVSCSLKNQDKIAVKVTGGQAKADNYNITYNVDDMSAAIYKAQITLEVPESSVTKTKEYDGTSKATFETFTAETGIGTDKVAIKDLDVQFNNKNVATSKRINVMNLDSPTFEGVEGTRATNYEITLKASTFTGEITKKQAMISGVDDSIEYGDAIPAYKATVEGLVSGESLTQGVDYTITCPATSLSAPGNYLIKPEIVETDVTSNYDFVVIRGVLSITQGDSYTVRFDSNGGYGAMDDQIIRLDEEQNLHANAYQRDYYTFLGWSVDRRATSPALADQDTVKNLTSRGGRITLYAVWKDNSEPEIDDNNAYTINFDANGGDGKMLSQKIERGKLTALSKNIFTKEGYNFIGWSIEKDATVRMYTDGEYVSDMLPAKSSTTLYAIWSDQEEPTPTEGYTIKFDKNGGEGAMGEQVVAYNTPTTLAKNGYYKDGYRFLGWSTNSEASAPSMTDQQLVTNLAGRGQTITLYAIWQDKSVDPVDPTENGYIIRFDANGGVGQMADQTVGIDTPTKLATNIFTRENHTFIGWSTNADSSAVSLYNEQEVTHLTEVGGTVTLYAVWRDNDEPEPDPQNCYTVQFDANGGVGQMAEQTIEQDEDTALAKNIFTRKDFRFTGWSTDPNAAVRQLKDEAVVNHLTDAGNTIVLYAVWQDASIPEVDPENAYTVHFDANGGIGTMSDQEVAVGVATQLARNSFEKEGCTFVGWSTVSNSSVASLSDGHEVINLAAAKQSVTLYAVWRDNSVEPVDPEKAYTVHFEANGGTGSMADQLIATDVRTPLAANAFVRANYTFVGWSTDANAKVTDRLYSNTQEVYNLASAKQTVTLYAVWMLQSTDPVDPETSYTVHFDNNGGEGEMTDQMIAVDTPTVLQRNTFTRSDHKFLGWSTESDAETPSLLDEAVVQHLADAKESVTLYAVWLSNSETPVDPGNPDNPDDPANEHATGYTIRYDANGGVFAMADQVVACNKTVKLNKNLFVREGYRFLGWSPDATAEAASLDDQDEVTNLTTKGKGVTLYAVWQDETITPVDPGNPDDPDDPANERATGYTVRFDANGGVGKMKDQVIGTDVATKLANNVFTKEGYVFLGWAKKAEATVQEYADGEAVTHLTDKGKRITLYAVWSSEVPELVKAPVAYTDLVYNTKAQDLVQAGEARGGAIMYGITTNADGSGVTEWTTTIPTETDAGTYYVVYYIKGDALHIDTEKTVLGPIVIEKAKEAVPVPALDLEYDGTVKEGVAQAKDGLYTVTGGDETKAGNYVATATLKDPANYQWSEEATRTDEANTAGLTTVAYADEENSDASVEIPWSIAKRGLTFHVESATKTQGDGDPTFGVTIDNLVEGEELTRDVDYSVTRDAGETPGDYAVTVTANDTEKMNNYSPTVDGGKLTIQAKAGSGNKNVLAAAKTWLTSTGDKLAVAVLGVLAVACASLFAIIVAKRRKRKGEEE